MKHKLAGKPTLFKKHLLEHIKIHTIRTNYNLWVQRFDEINRGNAKISIREWSDKPYRSKQTHIIDLTKEDGIGLQKLTYLEEGHRLDGFYHTEPLNKYAEKDGLSRENFDDWFKDVPIKSDLALIHFTKYRYKN